MPAPTLPVTSGLALRYQVDEGLWADVAGTSPATADGAPVARWDDLSGGGHHLTQATSGNRPTLLADSGYKARPALSFDHAAAQYLSNAAYAGLQGVGAWTWFVVYEADGIGPQYLAAGHSGILAVTGDAWAGWRMGAGIYGFWDSHANPRGNCVAMTFDGGAAQADRLGLTWGRLGRTLVYGPGVLAFVGATTDSPGAGVHVGSNGVNFAANTTYDGRIFEVAGYARVLSSGELSDLADYAGATYLSRGITRVRCYGDSLTKGHPDNVGAVGSGAANYPALLAVAEPAWEVHALGLTGYMIAAIHDPGGARQDSETNTDPWAARNVTIRQGGTNNMIPFSNDMEAAPTVAETVAVVAHDQSYGYTAGVVTVPAGGAPSLTGAAAATYMARVDAYNAACRAGDTGADFLVDLAADARFSDPTDATYFNPDGIHLTAVANAAWEEIAHAAILDALPDEGEPDAGTPLTAITSPNGGVLFYYAP